MLKRKTPYLWTRLAASGQRPAHSPGYVWAKSDVSHIACCVQVLFVPAPAMWLRPRRDADAASVPHYSCPVYRTAERRGVLATTGHSTNFVMFVQLPTHLPSSHWILRGVALLSALSD